MTSLLAMLLILVPAPMGESEPTGPAPAIQHLKWVKGAFESTVAVMEYVPVTKTIEVAVNGQKQIQNVTTYQAVQKMVRQQFTAAGVEVFDLAGKKIADADWQKALGPGATVLVTRDGQLPHAAYRKVFKEGTLIVVFKPVPVAPPPVPGPIAVPAPNGPKN